MGGDGKKREIRHGGLLCFVSLLREQLKQERSPASLWGLVFCFFWGFFLPLKRLLNCQIWKKIVWFDVTIACSGVQALGWEYKELESSGVHPLHINFSAGVGLSVPVPSTVTENKCLFFFEEMGTRIFPGKKAVLGHNCSIGEVCFWM